MTKAGRGRIAAKIFILAGLLGCDVAWLFFLMVCSSLVSKTLQMRLLGAEILDS